MFWDTVEQKICHIVVPTGNTIQAAPEFTLGHLSDMPPKRGEGFCSVLSLYYVVFDCTLETHYIDVQPKFGVSNPYIDSINPGGFPCDPFYGVSHDEPVVRLMPGGKWPVSLSRLDIIDPRLAGVQKYPLPRMPWALKNPLAHITVGLINWTPRPIVVCSYAAKSITIPYWS